jgi:hypothetical protein
MFDFSDPGPCPICAAPHCSCFDLRPQDDGQIVISLQPATADANVRLRSTSLAEAIQATLPPGAFTTGTYRGNPPRKKVHR